MLIENSQQDLEVLQACKDRLVLMQQGYFTYVSQADHQKSAKNVYAMYRYQHLLKLNNHEKTEVYVIVQYYSKTSSI